jgi:general secretion pathway protein A
MPFDDEALRRIHQLCHGVPRRINVLCDRALLVAQQTGRRGVDGDLITQAAREVFDDGAPAPRKAAADTASETEAGSVPQAQPQAQVAPTAAVAHAAPVPTAAPSPSGWPASAPAGGAAPGLRGFAAFVSGGAIAAAALAVGLWLNAQGSHAPVPAARPGAANTGTPAPAAAAAPDGSLGPAPPRSASGGTPGVADVAPGPTGVAAPSPPRAEPGIAATPAAVERPGAAHRPAGLPIAAAPEGGATAAAVTTPSPTTAADLDALFTPASRDEATAWRALAQLWGVALPPGDPCAVAPQRALRCYQSVGWLGPVRLLQRPGLLTLADAQGRVAHVLLLGLNDQQARVRAGGVERELPVAQLERLWRGDFATLWRTPPGYGGGDAVDDGPFASWLAERLPQVAAKGDTLPHGLHGLSARVFAFQLAHGLPPDGLPGPLTVMQINRASGVDEPKLLALR